MVCGLFSRWLGGSEPQQEADPDQQLLDQLKKAGSDLNKPHSIEFFLYFPSEESANQAAAEIRKEGCYVKVDKAADDSAWLCLATKEMIPEHSELVSLRKRFNEISQNLKGEYDGWGTPVVN